MNKNDLRYIKTEKNIKQAFIKVIHQVGFKNTSITKICEEALISRNTFYLHFETIDELLESLYQDLDNDFNRSLPDFQNIKDSTIWYIHVIDSNRELVQALLNCPTLHFDLLLYNYVVRKPNLKSYPDFDQMINDTQLQLNVAYMLEAMISYTKCWLDHYSSISLNDVIDVLYDLCYHPTITFEKRLEKLCRNKKGKGYEN